jgi:hypothetical protein
VCELGWMWMGRRTGGFRLCLKRLHYSPILIHASPCSCTAEEEEEEE